MGNDTFNGKPIYTLTDIGNSLRSVISRTYTHAYYIKAEIIKLNFYPRSGHCYPELVEKEGDKIKTQMRAIIWSAQYTDINARFLKITGEPMKDGISILCLASVEYSPKYGLSLYIQDVEPTYTLGEMARNKMEVIQRLKKENIFSLNKQKIMPLVPKRLAVISIETSKGYNDFIVTLNNNNRNYQFDCQLFPSLLQGEKAVGTMLTQLELIEKQIEQFDCVVIIRGGGGDAGLNCYDQYELAQRIATFPIPVLSGIGHSTNETITEMVSFMSKITPTEVAYFLIQQFEDFYQKIIDSQSFIYQYASEIFANEKQRMSQVETICQNVSFKILNRENQKLSSLQHSLNLSSKQIIDKNKYQLDSTQSMIQLFAKQCIANNYNDLDKISSKLTLLNPDNILKRGFSITFHNGKPVLDAAQLNPQDEVETIFYKGKAKSRIENTNSPEQ